ncbi:MULTISPECIES: hypothetical protein [unclassified Cryobacterium]|uniref:hypothetical protein n=1 Tax=unclassified Cryobacterium TaxID=2649013 RepID=UPI001069F59A|nr:MULTISPECIES: hypothetical protein [unclassified Cryobacterium]TFD09394.1 hypothetical protein E3T29_04430 [Cryobacterium sp. TMT1-66-1]TFD11881.1 hypothetical protein E3T35_08840 [Cryobacterium sp. TMT1-2-2]
MPAEQSEDIRHLTNGRRGGFGSPSSATKQSSNKTYLYTASIQIWNNGALQKTYQNRLSVRTSDWVIVTSYISRT